MSELADYKRTVEKPMIDSYESTIASLRDANKALTAENEALKHDIARHVQISSDEATRTDRLSAELAEARAVIEWYASAETEDDGTMARSFLASKEASR